MRTLDDKYAMYRPKKFLGQNFLVDDNISRKITGFLELKSGDNILEIGPGQGALTKFIIETGANFIAVDIDSSIIETLKKKFKKVKNPLTLIHKDFLEISFEEDLKSFDPSRKIKVAGNIPYNITSAILFKLFDIRHMLDTAVLMMQKEVATRLTASPDTKDYGILAVQTQARCRVERLFNVPPTSFFPKPNVDSTVVKLSFGFNEHTIDSDTLFKRVVRESFSMRRKTMKNSLKTLFEKLQISPEKINFDFSRRAENVPVSEFVKLANDINEINRINGAVH
jgi:16S rRNA (adenine1518-N6/adenine1519-N6)-dimethyltransferase